MDKELKSLLTWTIVATVINFIYLLVIMYVLSKDHYRGFSSFAGYLCSVNFTICLYAVKYFKKNKK